MHVYVHACACVCTDLYLVHVHMLGCAACTLRVMGDLCVMVCLVQNESRDWPLLLAAGFGYLDIVQQLHQVS